MLVKINLLLNLTPRYFVDSDGFIVMSFMKIFVCICVCVCMCVCKYLFRNAIIKIVIHFRYCVKVKKKLTIRNY